MEKLGMEGYIRPSITEALHGHNEERQKAAQDESGVASVHQALSFQEKQEREDARKTRRYGIAFILALLVAISVVFFLYPSKADSQPTPSAELSAVTFVPTKAKLKTDPLLLPLDILRPKEVDEKYRSMVAKLLALGYQEAGYDLDPPEFRGKCVVLPIESFYLMVCRGQDVDKRPKELLPNIPYSNFEEMLVMMRSFSRDLRFSYLKRNPQNLKSVPQSLTPFV